MGLYDRYVLPVFLDLAMGQKILNRERARIVPQARGKVIELGIGSGLNLPHYRNVASVTGVDPSDGLQNKAVKRARQVTFPVEHQRISAETLPFDDGLFDTAVFTWTMCTIPDAGRALSEVRRVLKKDGKVLFIEHGLSPEQDVADRQVRMDRWWHKCTGGCHLGRKSDALIRDAGFRFDSLEAGYIKGPKFASYLYRGVARIA